MILSKINNVIELYIISLKNCEVMTGYILSVNSIFIILNNKKIKINIIINMVIVNIIIIIIKNR